MNIVPPDDYMSLALRLAERGRLTVSPNPMVGCVLVNHHHEIVGTGFHQQAGGPHAEIVALQQAAGDAARGAIAYVTLEPCCHVGKTPPCVEALIAANIKEIYVACLDPNPLVAGKGIAQLKAAGIKVHVGRREEEAKKLNNIFFHYMRTERPFVMAKWAMSLDGKTVTMPEDDKRISGAVAKSAVHTLRQIADAVLIGAKTAIEDDPLLTVRDIALPKEAIRQPKRIVLSTKGELPLSLRLLNDEWADHTIIATTQSVPLALEKKCIEKNIEILMLPKNNRVDLLALLRALGKKNITSVLVEGGMSVHESFFNADLINEVHVHLSPVIIAQLKNKKKLKSVIFQPIGNDYYFSAKC